MSDITILDVPDVALEKILSYLSFEEIATNRLICKQFNNICGGLLTKGFIQLEKKHGHIYKLVRAHLPRRPSERRSNMVVSRYCEILHGMESRIRMLNMTYMRYIDRHLICFLPGKVLDEISRLLRLIESKFDPPNNINQLMEELRDLSSMAMEHFDEHILPLVEKQEEEMQFKNVIPSTLKSPEDEKMQKELRKLHKRNRVFKTQVGYLIAKTRRLSEKWNRQNIRMKKQSSIIKEQNARLQVQTTRIQNHEMTITEMKKKFEELQANLVEIKSKLEFDTCQNVHVPPTATLPSKDPTSDVESNAMSSNLRRMIQYETMRQKTNILRKINNRGLDKPAMNKPRSPKLKVEEAKRRRFKSMVDVDIWRHRCPTSRLSYSLWQRNYSRPKPNKLEMPLEKEQPLNIAQPSTSDSQKNTKRDFVYKSVIKQRASRVFPLSCLELERKRKSFTRPDIPTKLSKIEANSALKSLEIINKYFPLRDDVSRSEVTKEGCNVLPRSISTKRKRDLGDA